MKTFTEYFNRLPVKTRSFVQTCVYGLAAGIAAALFHVTIHSLFRLGIEESAAAGNTMGFVVSSFLILTATCLAAGLLMTFICPEAAGSGVPQVKVAFWERFGVMPIKMVIVKFLAGALTIGGGSSLGREGPTVHICSGLASFLAPLMGVAKQNRRIGAAAGAAAGLAAAFNAPLTAIIFVLEEIIEDMNSRLLGSVILASLIGAIVTHAIFGEEPAFQMAEIESHSWLVYAFVPVIAAFAALCGVGFHRLTLLLRRVSRQQLRLPLWLQPMVGGWATWILGCSVFLLTGSIGVFGMGYYDLTLALNNQMIWWVAGVLLLAKLLATSCCYSTGGCGGIFAPTLFLGGMASVFLTGLINLACPLDQQDQMLLAVVGLSACLGAVVRAPITSILIVFEMTQQFSLVPSLLIGTLVSQWIARQLTSANFYEAILHQDGHDLRKVVPPRDLHAYRQLPVWTIASLKPVLINDLSPQALSETLEQFNYKRFPVVNQDGELTGILTREAAQLAIRESSAAHLVEATVCQRDMPIGEVQGKIIESATGCVVIADPVDQNRPAGLLTLHDLLRAEAEMGKRLPGV